MKLGYDLKLEQSQKLIMTPELRQAIELLQLNTVELNEYITRELEENPMLESDNTSESESLEEHSKVDEINWADYFEKSDSYEYKNEIDKNLDHNNFESFIKYEPSLNEYLVTQVNLAGFSRKEEEIAKYILENIDDDGYLILDISNIAMDLDIEEPIIRDVLKVVQQFDPKGIASRNLKECLLNQINEEHIYAKDIIEGYLEDIAYNRINKISKELEVDENIVLETIEYIKRLEPKPGRYLSNDIGDIKYISPDAEIKFLEGKFQVFLNEDIGPRLNISNFYKNMMRANKDINTTKFLNERFNRAMWVIQSIEQRRTTIKKVLESIVKFQVEFLLEGEKFLKPMNMKKVADDIGMHESTVSRATTGKYVQTPQGLFELKYFFTNGLLGINGDVSAVSIKSSIKDLVDNENPKKPLSDQKISDILKENGTRVSRRTVAKYRSEMNILSSSMRRG